MIAVLVLGMAVWTTGAQDRDTERIDGLETAVAELTVRVGALEPAAVGVSGSPEATTGSETITGELLVFLNLGLMGSSPGAPCSGADAPRGYENITSGAGIVVYDEDRTVVGSGEVGLGVVERIETGKSGNYCRYVFEVDVAPAAFYTIEVAGRGGPTLSHGDLVDAGWNVELSIG